MPLGKNTLRAARNRSQDQLATLAGGKVTQGVTVDEITQGVVESPTLTRQHVLIGLFDGLTQRQQEDLI